LNIGCHARATDRVRACAWQLCKENCVFKRAGLTAAAVIAAFTVLFLAGSPVPALAHERRQLGKYTMVVGFLGEPAYVNQQNGLDLRVYTLPEGTDPATAPSSARIGTENLEKTLKAEVIFGGESQKMALTLEPRFRDPGAYDGHFFPTAAGDYTFHIFGTIEGMNVDETFTSSPEGFSSVEEVRELEFPKKLMSAQDVEAELATLKASASTPAASNADDDSTTLPTVLAIIGILAGAAGLLVGGFALARGRS
jgi:hypothetical protein